MRWLIQLWRRFLDKAIDYLLGSIVVALCTAFILYWWDWLSTPMSVQPAILVLLVVIIFILAIGLYRYRPKKRFKSFSIHDNRMNVLWWIQSDPNHWIDTAFDPHNPDSYTDSILEGPYCAVEKVNGDLCLGGFASQNGHLEIKCENCRRNFFEFLTDGEDVKVSRDVQIPLSKLKLMTLRRIQREARRGKRVKKGMSFDFLDV